jgi:hypothetical protein
MIKHLILAKLRSISIFIVTGEIKYDRYNFDNGFGESTECNCLNGTGLGYGYGISKGCGFGFGFGFGYDYADILNNCNGSLIDYNETLTLSDTNE